MKILEAKLNGKKYEVVAKGMQINITQDGEESYGTFTFDKCDVTVDGEMTNDFGESFSGHIFEASEVAASLVRSFINDDRSVDFENMFISKPVQAVKETFMDPSEYELAYTDNGDMRVVPKFYLGEYNLLPIQMLDNAGCAYYSDGNEFIITRKDGSVATDMEEFYENAMIDAVSEKSYVFISDNVSLNCIEE